MLPSINVVKATKGKSQYLALTNDLFNMYSNDPKLIPRSTYRKNVGEGIRTITFAAHTSLVASERSGKFVTNVTIAVGHAVCLMKCHKLAATLMPEKFPYLCITVVHLTTGEALLPHKDVQNHRLFRNTTTSFGDWTGGVLQTEGNGTWTDHDSRDAWVVLDARTTSTSGHYGKWNKHFNYLPYSTATSPFEAGRLGPVARGGFSGRSSLGTRHVIRE